MLTRILRMIDRTPIETPSGPWRHPVWRVAGLGQLQPVLFGREGARGITLRIEGAMGDQCVWHVLPLRTHRKLAKALFAALEWHKAHGTPSAARAAWIAGKAAGIYR
jgi:hypothetical protein